MIQSSSILTVGSLAFDTVATPSGKAENVLGGSGNYFSIAASFYSPVSVVGVVGEDFPKAHLDSLTKRGIDVSGIEITKGKTFHWTGVYEGDLSEAKTLSTQLNVFEHFSPKLSSAHRETPYVFLANIDPVIQLDLLTQVKSPRLIACDSMNFWISGKPQELKKTLEQVDILSLNEMEAKLLTGIGSFAGAAREILKMGPKAVVLKRGEYGAGLFTQTSTLLAPAFPTEKVTDPTGAGDSFAGAFLGYLAKEGMTRETLRNDPKKADPTLRKALLAGCVMASFTVEDFSFKRLESLNVKEIEERGSRLLEMTRF